MRPAHPVRHWLCRRANQLSVVPAVNRRATGAAFRRRPTGDAGAAASAGGPCDEAKHHDSGDGTAVRRCARRSTGGQTQIEGVENCLGHHRVCRGLGRTRRGRLVWVHKIQGTQGGARQPGSTSADAHRHRRHRGAGYFVEGAADLHQFDELERGGNFRAVH